MTNLLNRPFPVLLQALLPALLCGALAGCGETVDCEALCVRTLKCNVSFQPSDDPDRSKVVVGDRTEQESCEVGCLENEVVTVEAGLCIENVPILDGQTCQQEMLNCLGANVTEDDGL